VTDPPITPLQGEAILEVLTRHAVDFVVIGGFSLGVHGSVRATKDVDVVPEPSPGNLERLASALQDLEAKVDLADDFDPEELGIEPDADGLAFGGNWVLTTRLGRLDVLQTVAGVSSYDALRADAVVAPFGAAGRVAFASIDDLIAMKVAANRPQDQIDVADLERARGASD